MEERIGGNMVIRANGAASNELAASRKAERHGQENKNGTVKNGSVFGGNLKQKFDPVYAKKAQAQKKAMRMWADAAGAEQDIDRDLEKRSRHMDDLRKEISALNDEVNSLSAMQDELKEKYGITAADEEDLALLKKADGVLPDLTEDEKARLKQLEGSRVSEYYGRYSDLEEQKGNFIADRNKKQKEYVDESRAITSIQNERLKSHTMIDAQKNKDEMMIAASKDAAFGLMNEVKDKLDEHQEELAEKAEEKAEEEKKEEELLEAIRDKANENRDDDDDDTIDIVDTNEILQKGEQRNDIKQDVKKMVNEMNLLVEDLKGAAVDKQL